MSKKRPILLYGFYQKHLVGRRHQRTGSVFLRLVQKLSGISRPPWMNQQIRSILLFENLIFLQFRLASLKGERLSLHGERTCTIMHLVMPRVWSANKISLLLLMWKTMCIRSRDMQAILERCFFAFGAYVPQVREIFHRSGIKRKGNSRTQSAVQKAGGTVSQ